MFCLSNRVGIELADDDYDTIIGGAVPAAGNVISGNMIGINVAKSHGAIIQNNLIGLASDRTTPLGNEYGIHVFDGDNMKIGGTVPLLKFKPAVSAGNIIAFNTVSGVRLLAGEGNLISRNQIPDNAGLGIDLGEDGVTANDECDVDSGPNGLQNFPIISTAGSANGVTTITGHLNTTANKPYRIEFFTNTSCDLSGNGEGAVYLGSILVSTAPKNCETGFTATFKTSLPPNTVITATATHPSGSTSEFSPCAFVSAGPQ